MYESSKFKNLKCDKNKHFSNFLKLQYFLVSPYDIAQLFLFYHIHLYMRHIHMMCVNSLHVNIQFNLQRTKLNSMTHKTIQDGAFRTHLGSTCTLQE